VPTPRLRWFLGGVALFGLGHASDAFLLLKAGTAGVPTPMLPVLWMALHIVKSVASAASGPVADRLGRRRVIGAGWIVSALIYLGFAAAHTTDTYALLFVVYGLYHGLTEGSEKAVATELAAGATGTALGWYNLVAGLVVLPAGLLFGAVWEIWGAPIAFGMGAGFALAGLLPLAMSSRMTPAPA
jgi:MFS family permease